MYGALVSTRIPGDSLTAASGTLVASAVGTNRISLAAVAGSPAAAIVAGAVLQACAVAAATVGLRQRFFRRRQRVRREASPVGRREKLPRVRFGSSDMMVSEVCGGTMMWGSFIDKEEQAHDQLDALMRLDVNFIDTAEMYPVGWDYGATTEQWIGNWLTKRIDEGRMTRSDIYISTKCNSEAIGMPDLDGRPELAPHGYDEEVLLHACRASLERLQCDYIDLYHLHWPCRDMQLFGCGHFYPEGKERCFRFFDTGGPESFERQVLAVKQLLDAGLIKHWALSNESAYGITMFCTTCDRLGVPRPVSCQNDFSLLNRMYEGDTYEAAYRFGVVGLPYGVLAGGVLTAKYLEGGIYAGLDKERPLAKCRHGLQPAFQPRYGSPLAMLATERYAALAERWGLTPTELALAWARDRACNASIIIGSTTVRQVEECVNAFKIERLPEELVDAVEVLFEEFRNPANHHGSRSTVIEGAWLSSKRKASDLGATV